MLFTRHCLRGRGGRGEQRLGRAVVADADSCGASRFKSGSTVVVRGGGEQRLGRAAAADVKTGGGATCYM